jgi:hypothetical protein
MRIHIIGNPPGWLLGMIRELGIDVSALSECNIEGPAIVILGKGAGECSARNTVVLDPASSMNALNAKALLVRGIRVLGAVDGADLRGALVRLGFTQVRVTGVISEVELAVEGVKPRVLYTVCSLSQQLKVTTGRGTARGGVYLDSGLIDDVMDGEVYMAKGGLVDEVRMLGMLTGMRVVEL